MTAGEVEGREVTVRLPPVVESFWLPSRESLLKVKVGDFVKLIFDESGQTRERMWVRLTAREDNALWKGVLSNEPASVNAKPGDIVAFHPLAVIGIQMEDV